jgi:hypothetical protein
MKNPLRTLPAILLALFAAGAVHAAPIPLSDLLAGGSITVGDKLFGDWRVVSYATTDVGRSFNAENIEVDALTGGGLDPGPGLRFDVNAGELTVTAKGSRAFIDLVFGFSVTTLDPSLRITGNSLQYPAGGAFWLISSDQNYDAGSSIRENLDTTRVLADSADVGNLGTTEIEFSTMADGSGDSSISVISDTATFAPQSTVWVTKSVSVWARDTADSAGISSFDQRFSQMAVPEPTTLALVVMALAGMLAPTAQRHRRDAEA